MDPRTKRAASTAILAGIGGGGVAQAQLALQQVGRYSSGVYSTDGGAAEISAFDPASRRLFVVNAISRSIDVLDLSNPALPTALTPIGLSAFGVPNSLAVRNGVLAVAVEDSVKTNPGAVRFYRAGDGTFLASAGVGALPDMLTFSPDGTRVIVANEGEPNSYGQADSVDPEGSVSIIDVSVSAGNVTVNGVQTAGFAGFNGQAAALRAQGVRIFGTGASVAQDLEPEYVALSPDGSTAYVSLQEANALATIDVATATVTSIRSFGLKDHSLPGNGIDPGDRDNAAGNGANVSIRNVPVKGMYQPDAISTVRFNGQTYLVTANEGDARDYTGLAEEVRVGSGTYVLDPSAFPNAAALKTNQQLGRLTVTNQTGDLDGDGDFDEIHVFGGRSFSVWSLDAAGGLGAQVFDNGDSIEQLTAARFPANFNASHSNNLLDDRSDNKGPEPEGLVVGEAYGRTFGFVGLERIGGVLMYDLTDPTNPTFLDYVNPRDFSVTPSQANLAAVGDLGPEGLLFISAADSPNGLPLLVVTNEVSGTTTVFSVVPEPSAAGLLAVGSAALAMRRRRGLRGRA